MIKGVVDGILEYREAFTYLRRNGWPREDLISFSELGVRVLAYRVQIGEILPRGKWDQKKSYSEAN